MKPSAPFLSSMSLVVLSLGLASANDIRIVARSGQAIPGANPSDMLAGSFFVPTIGPTGDVSFNARIDTEVVPGFFVPKAALLSERDGILTVLAREDEPAPQFDDGAQNDYNGLWGNSPGIAMLNGAGDSAFAFGLRDSSGSGSNTAFLSSGSQNTIQGRARLYGTAPDAPTGSKFQFLEFSRGLRLNEIGTLAFDASVEVVEGDSLFTRTAIYVVQENDQLTPILWGGTEVPDHPGTYFDQFSFVNSLNLNSNDQLVFAANIVSQDPILGSVGGRGIFAATTSGEVSVVAVPLQPLTSDVNGLRFGDGLFSSTTNARGEIAFAANIGVPDFVDVPGVGLVPDVYSITRPAVVLTAGDAFAVVAQQGEAAPDSADGVVFGHGFNAPVLSNSGAIAFLASLEGNGIEDANNVGLFMTDNGTLKKVVQLGEIAPEAPDDAVFTRLYEFGLNAQGRLAFGAEVATNETKKKGIWASDGDGQVRLVALEGVTEIDFSDDPAVADPHLLTQLFVDFAPTGLGTATGRPTFFNDLGQIVIAGAYDNFAGQLVYVDNSLATATIVEGDYNRNGIVDAADYTVWKDAFGSTINLDADGNKNGVIDAADYTIWKDNFGATLGQSLAISVPEPANLALILSGGLCCAVQIRRRPVGCRAGRVQGRHSTDAVELGTLRAANAWT
ncbi:MAG: hypothetical protein R3E01_36620 [Pirellulaceae bacterium]|nr:hypothetical protein [Planctomycetales bacterium]